MLVWVLELAKKGLDLDDLIEEIGERNWEETLEQFPLYQEEAYNKIAKLLGKVGIVSWYFHKIINYLNNT